MPLLDLKRLVRLCGYLVGIVFVLVGLVACIPQNTKDKDQVPPVPITGIIDHTKTWWGKSHNDKELLKKEVNLSKCFRQTSTTSWKIKAGFYIPFSSIRIKTWQNYLRERRNGKDTPKMEWNVAASMVPYIVVGEQKFYINVNITDDGKKFSYSCDKSGQAIIDNVERYSHYYPTVEFIPIQESDANWQEKFFDELKKHQRNINTQPVELSFHGSTTIKMRELLKKFFDNSGAIKTNFLYEHGIHSDIGVKVEPNQLDGVKDIILVANPETTKVSVNPNDSTTVDSAVRNENEYKLNDTSPNMPKKHQVEIQLPADFVKIVGGASALMTKMTLDDCEDAITNYRTDENLVTFSVECSKSPVYIRNIEGFEDIPISKKNGLGNGAEIFTANKEHIQSKKINFQQGYNDPYYNDDRGQPKKCSIRNNRVPYHCINKELVFPYPNLPRCHRKGTIYLDTLKQGGSLQLTHTPCYVDLKLPLKLLSSPTRQCNLQADQITLRCDLSDSDISRINKTFMLNFGSGWEPSNVTVDISRQTHNIQADKFMPSWPFNTTDDWWAKKNSTSYPGAPSCDKKDPEYTVKEISYSNSLYTSKKVLWSTKQLPTLKDIGWEEGNVLPNTITLKLVQQGTQTAKAYKQTAEINWQLSQVSGSTWTLSSKYRTKLEEPSLSVRPIITDPTLLGSGNYEVFQYPSMAACRQNKGATLLGPYSQRQQRSLNIKPCTYLKLYDEQNVEAAASRCTQLDKYNRVVFKPRSCGKKRKLVVISTGIGLNSKTLKNAIIKVFQETVNQSNIPPFTVVAMQSGRELSDPLLTCEYMGEVESTKARQVVSTKLGSLSFMATDLQALKDLSYVHQQYQPENLDSVFYLVDGDDVPDRFDPMTDLNIPEGWKKRHIRLTVMTTKSCDVWHQAGASCYLWSTNTIENVLGDFLNPTR